MKRLFTLLIFAITCLGNALAWEPVIKECHYFGMIYPDSYDPVQNYEINCGNWTGKGCDLNYMTFKNQYQPNTVKVSYKAWTDNTKSRFALNVPSNWKYQHTDNAYYSGPGLYNNSDNGTNFWIKNLEPGDQFIFEFYRYQSTGNMPTLVIDNDNPGSTVDGLQHGSVIAGTTTYTCSNGGNVCIRVPSKAVIRSVTIIHSNYKKATYRIDEIEENGNKGYKYTLTGAGVLEDKRGAVPYITMRFGNDKDQTFVRDLGDGNFGSSCIIDESHDLDVTHDNVRLTANYKKKYMNEDNHYSYSTTDLHENLPQDQQEAIKQRAINEANMLKGREWSIFEADNYWNNNSDWDKNHYKHFKWDNDFNSIYPLYGTYYYFFPEVDGKLDMDFFCEGSGEHMAFWYKTKDDGNYAGFDEQPSVTPTPNTTNTNGTNNYHYSVNVKKGGVYYLCSNPTIISREHPVIRLKSYQFIPSFRVEPLYKVVDNGTTDVEGAAEILGGPFSDLNGKVEGTIEINGESAPKVKCLGSIESAEPVVEERNGRQFLDIKNIKFKDGENVNKGGVVVVNLECSAGKATYVLTVAYKASEKNIDGNPKSTEVKKWDFYTEPLKIGKYSDGSGTYPSDAWTNSSQLYKEVHKADGLTSDWTKTYMNLHDNSEPIFKSVYDMEGDNADMLEETEGLIFLTEANQLGIYNENDKSTKDKFNDRYIGLLPGGKLIIPKLSEGDRIVIKMNRYGTVNGKSEAHLEIGNGKDAIGTDINSDYIIGGSDVTESIPDKSQPHGEYHFIAKGGDFSLTLTDGPLLKLYTIEIYKHENTIITENEVLGDNRYILYTSEDNGAKTTSINLHYNGKGEPFAYLQTAKKTGKFKNENISFEQSGNKFNYTPASNLFGTFRPRLAVRTTNSAYVTDYADYSIAVGYRETKEYPYTWDFTDLKKYVKESNQIDENGNEKDVDDDVKIWKDYSLQVKDPETDGGLFVNGSQLYAGDKMFEESAGIGIHHFNYNKNHNGKMTITDEENGGLRVTDGTQAWRFIVPQVKTGQAIYVRASKTGDEVKAKYIEDGTTEADFTNVGTDGDEVVFKMIKSGDANAKGDVSLCFKGYEIKKIAVSEDFKSVNSLGYATESRARDIDHSLTSYFSAGNIKAYRVSDVDYQNSKVTLTEVDKVLKSALEKAEGRGVILYNTAEGKDKTVTNFGLFVPDMHDTENTLDEETETNMLWGNLSQNNSIGANPGDYTNYLLSSTGKNEVTGETITGVEAFYRASKTAKLGPNKAYLPLLTASVKPSATNPTGAKMNIVFDEIIDEEEETTVTGMENTFINNDENDTYYTLSGMKIERPTKKGIYIKNGKKVIIK